MKPTLCALLLLTGSLFGTGAAEDETMKGVEIKIVKVSSSGSLIVELNNTSRRSLRIWKESNSWGAARWRVLVIRQGQIETFFQNPNQRFTRNIPAFTEIEVGGHVDATLDLNRGNWCGLGHCSS